MTADTTPSIVERLNSSAKAFRDHPIYTADGDPVKLTVQAQELEEAASRITEQADENEKLRLAICGGEDAPGYAASLPLADILRTQADNFARASHYSELAYDGEGSTWKARAEAAEANARRLEEAAGPFLKLAAEVINPVGGERPWHADSQDWMVVFGFAGQTLTLGDLRRAAALTTKEADRGPE